MTKRRFIFTPRFLALMVGLLLLALPLTAFAGGDGNFQEYASRGWLWMFAASFGFGFLVSLTPCVYPMIPIIISVFGARDEGVGRGKAFALATFYVLGMGTLFASLGLAFALVGKTAGFGSLLANPWVVVPVVLMYCALAASMFGAFELRLPYAWQGKLNQVGGKGYLGAFGLGLVGGLTAAPCTGPFLISMLTFVAVSGNPVAGFGLLFVHAMGIGILFWVIAVFAVSMPKSGAWMEWVKSVGGISLLVVSAYFLRPILPALTKLTSTQTSFLYAAVAVAVVGLAIGAVHLSFHDNWLRRVRKGVGVLLVVSGAFGVINWALTPDRTLPWVYDEDAAFAQAKSEGKGVMVDFSASYCTPCKRLEVTFAADQVYPTLIDNYVFLKFDVSGDTERDEELQERYNAGLPTVIFLDADRREHGRVTKYLDPSDFLDVLRPATARLRGAESAAL